MCSLNAPDHGTSRFHPARLGPRPACLALPAWPGPAAEEDGHRSPGGVGRREPWRLTDPRLGASSLWDRPAGPLPPRTRPDPSDRLCLRSGESLPAVPFEFQQDPPGWLSPRVLINKPRWTASLMRDRWSERQPSSARGAQPSPEVPWPGRRPASTCRPAASAFATPPASGPSLPP